MLIDILLDTSKLGGSLHSRLSVLGRDLFRLQSIIRRHTVIILFLSSLDTLSCLKASADSSHIIGGQITATKLDTSVGGQLPQVVTNSESGSHLLLQFALQVCDICEQRGLAVILLNRFLDSFRSILGEDHISNADITLVVQLQLLDSLHLSNKLVSRLLTDFGNSVLVKAQAKSVI